MSDTPNTPKIQEIPSKPTEIVDSEEVAFFKAILARADNKCENCGSVDHVYTRQIVPAAARGKWVASNGVALCRVCDLASDTAIHAATESGDFVVSIWMSKSLKERMDKILDSGKSFRSWSSLSRYLVSKYLSDEPRFEDLELYQDDGNDLKVTIRVDHPIYKIFFTRVKERKLSITDAMKGMYLLYMEELGELFTEAPALAVPLSNEGTTESLDTVLPISEGDVVVAVQGVVL